MGESAVQRKGFEHSTALCWKAAGLSPAIPSEGSEGLYDSPSFLGVGVIHLHSCSFSLPSPSPSPFPPPKINCSPWWSAVLWLVLTRIVSLTPGAEVGNSCSLKPAVLQRGEAVSLVVLLCRCSVAVAVQHTSWVWQHSCLVRQVWALGKKGDGNGGRCKRDFVCDTGKCSKYMCQLCHTRSLYCSVFGKHCHFRDASILYCFGLHRKYWQVLKFKLVSFISNMHTYLCVIKVKSYCRAFSQYAHFANLTRSIIICTFFSFFFFLFELDLKKFAQ